MDGMYIGVKGRVRITRLPWDARAPLGPQDLDELIAGRLAQVALETDNLVTAIGLQTLAAMLAGGWGNPTVGATAYTPSNIHDPTPPISGAYAGGLRVTAFPSPGLLPPTAGDTALQGTAIFTRTVDGAPPLVVTYPFAGRVVFSALVPQLDFNGTTFTEEGLFSADGQLIARTTFSEVKTNAYALQLDHMLTVSRI